jgi:glycosyltransferase involved in cell wall biosynthesis
VRNEADVIGDTLGAALEWVHDVRVLDHASSDGTWDELQALAAREPRIVLAGRRDGPFYNGLRAELAASALGEARLGDWWYWLDADEFVVDDPTPLLAGVPLRYGVVYGAFIEYYLTELDMDRSDAHGASFRDLRHYVTGWSEERFVRHVPGAAWRVIERQPVWRERVLIRHYQYRAPTQIDLRLATRVADPVFGHEPAEDWNPTDDPSAVLFPVAPGSRPDWRNRAVRSSALSYDRRDGQFTIDWAALPALPTRPPWRSLLSRSHARLRWAQARRFFRAR